MDKCCSCRGSIVRVTLRCARALLIVGLVISLVMGCSSSQGPDEIVALIENIVGNCDGTLGKLSEQKKQFESDGNVRGERLMDMAAHNVKITKKKSLSVKRQIDPPGRAGALMSSALADSPVSPQKAQAEMKEGLHKKSCCIGPGLCGTSEKSQKAKFVEFLFHDARK
jgi:hypothetical protein